MAIHSPKLYAYTWRGTTQKGSKVKGKTLAYTELDARNTLTEQRITIARIKRRPPSSWIKKRNSATHKDITVFSQQMGTMLEAGVPLSNILQLLKNSAKKAEMKQIIGLIYSHIESGSSLSQAMKASSILFDQFYCDLVSTGEETGRLDLVFQRICLYREKNEKTRSKIIHAMIYPCIVFSLALVVTVGMMLFVIPTFKDVFSSFNAQLPWFTQKVFSISDTLHHSGLFLLIGVFISFAGFRFALRKSYAFRLKTSKFILHLPIIGELISKASIARFTRTLATTFSAGIPVLTGLSAAKKTAKNTYFKTMLEAILQQTAGGRPLHRSIRETGAFPDMVIQMVMIGEESGALDKMLNKVASIYEDDVENTVDNLGTILEPLIIVTLGILIGSLVIAMYLPMFDLMRVMG